MTESKDQKTEGDGQSVAQALGKLIALALVVLAVILIERYCVPKPQPFGLSAMIVAIGGDTLRAGDGAEYRILGIDAPERRQSCNGTNGKSWLCGRAAKAKLTTLSNRGNVKCEARANDRFDRIVAVCSAKGARHLAGNLRPPLRLAPGQPTKRRKLIGCSCAGRNFNAREARAIR